MVTPTVLVALDIANNLISVSKIVADPLLAFLPKHLDLKVLIAIEIHEVVFLVSSQRVNIISGENLKRPPTDLPSLLMFAIPSAECFVELREPLFNVVLELRLRLCKLGPCYLRLLLFSFDVN